MLEYKRTTALILSLLMAGGSASCAAQATPETETTFETVLESEVTETTLGMSSFVKSSYWLGSETGEFENTSYLSLVVDMDEDVMNAGFVPFSVARITRMPIC